MNEARYPESLRRSWPEPYVYPSRLKRVLARLLDLVAGFFFRPSPLSIPWHQIERVAVLRLDHLGDLLQSFEALAAMRRAMPRARIDLFVGPWGKELASFCPSVNAVFEVEAPWFNRPHRKAWPFKAIRALGKRLAIGQYDLVVELRGDFRHHLAARLSGAPLRLGLAQTAGRFLLTHAAPFEAGLHERQQNFTALKVHGMPGSSESIKLKLRLPASARPEAVRVARELKLKKGYIAVQAASGTAAKRWMPEKWAQVLSRFKTGEVVLLGSAAEIEEMQTLANLCKPRPALAAGKLSLAGLAVFLEQASLVLSVDSGPAHFAVAMGTPLVSLYSGTNRLEQWGPLGKKNAVLQKTPLCSPCELAECPFENECMRRIEPDEVLDKVDFFLKRKFLRGKGSSR